MKSSWEIGDPDGDYMEFLAHGGSHGINLPQTDEDAAFDRWRDENPDEWDRMLGRVPEAKEPNGNA